MTEHEKHNDNVGDSRDDTPSEHRDDQPETSQQASTDVTGDSAVARSEPVAGQGVADHSQGPKRSGPLVWLALLVALASLGLASYPFWSQWLTPAGAEQSGPSASEFERLSDRVDTIVQDRDSEIDALRADLDKLRAGTGEPTGPSVSEFERLSGRVDTIAQDSNSEIAALRADLDKLSSRFEADEPGPDASELADRIDQLSVRVERLQGDRDTALGDLRTRLEALESDFGRRFEQFELRLSNVGSNLDRADHDLATRLLLMEVDSLFAIAQNHLVARGDGGVALQAWERATERLTALEGAEFQTLKDTARREFNQLRDYRPPDLGTQIEQLFGMADAVAAWPVKTIQPGQPTAEPGSSEGWRARLGQVVGSLVRVESVDREFLGPDEIDLARERVRSSLQTAALAMVRSRPDLARRLIGEAADAAQGVFDTEAGNVAEALNRLEDIAESAEQVEPPELTESRAEISRLLGGIR